MFSVRSCAHRVRGWYKPAIALATLAASLTVFAGPTSRAGSPLPGQIVIDPAHPHSLMRHGGGRVFICGPGDPEDFLYLGRRNPDGTRDGDQVQRIGKLIEHGGNSIYMQIVRTHGGDANEDQTHNPFVNSDPVQGLDEEILGQWEEWFSLMDRSGIVIYLFFYDDGARIWDTGDLVGPEEKAFLEGIVHKFKHHKNLIWLVAEESEERYSGERVGAIAEIIRDADDHGHIIGNHHLSGTVFKDWKTGRALTHLSMQLSETGDRAHTGAIEARQKAADRYQVIYSESTAMGADGDSMRRHAWAVAMGGLMPMLLGMDIADTPATILNQCRYLQRFFEATDFYTMAPHDELAHGETKWVLAHPGNSYIAYAENLSGKMGIKALPAGQYAVTWMDCRSGRTMTLHRAIAESGDHSFDKPDEIGQECVAAIRRANFQTAAPSQLQRGDHAGHARGDYFPSPESAGGWRKLDKPEDIRRLAGMDPDKLDQLKEWLLASDKRNFAAVVIRNGYIVLEVERSHSAKTDARRLASVSKAICATVLAIASERSQQGLTPKKMSFDDLAFQFIPWAQPLSDPRKEKITVRQLFNHTSGLCPEATGAPNDGTWAYVLGHSGDARTAMLAFDPGTNCGYSTHAFDHASLVCETVTGMPYDEFAIQALFKPIGCEHWWFQYFDGDGKEGEKYGRHPTHGLGMPARDLARVAYCMLRGGRWNDRQIIPQWFVEETAAPTHDLKIPEMRFALNAQTFSHGWQLPARLTGEGSRSGRGIPADARHKPGSGGQLIAFVPSLDLVVTRQTGSSGAWEYEEYLRRACQAVVREKAK